MRLVPIECVRDGCTLAKTLYDNLGRPLLREGVPLTTSLLNKIKEIQIYSIYIQDEYSDREIEDIIKPELRQKSIKILKDTFSRISKLYLDIDVSTLTTQRKNLILKEKELYLESIKDLAEELFQNITSNKNILVNLVDIKSMDNYTYQHSVNVAILSLVLGIGLNLPKHDLISLLVGALLHDLGKVFIDGSILKKPGPLTNDEYNEMKMHPQKGYDYIKNLNYISAFSKLIILQHHERADGNGYPNKLENNKINKLSKIVSIADVYDALTSDRPYRRGMCPNEAFEYVLGNSGVLFDYNMVKAFSQIIVPYPCGTIVRLSNGEIAVVEDTPPNFPLRPNVKIIKSNNKHNIGQFLNLMNELSLVILSVEYSL